MKKIPFNKPFIPNNAIKNISKVFDIGKFSGDGYFTKECSSWLEKNTKSKKVLLTTSCTHALELSAILINIKPGDEVIMPSFTFVSSANAFVLRGAKVVFVDIRPDTMNIDGLKIEQAITNNTKAIIPVHYAGVACEMNKIMDLANKYNLFVIEDAAQGLMSSYKGKSLGSIGHFGCISFHETKDYQCGEGGALIINHDEFIDRAEILREKGTNRNLFLKGIVDKYRWVDIGSSYLPSELNAAFLMAQFQMADKIKEKRLLLWNEYSKNLREYSNIKVQEIPQEITHNGHMFFIKLKDVDQRQKMIDYLKSFGIQSVFHYIPLHESKKCKEYNIFNGKDEYTSRESERILRLPLYYDLNISDIKNICKTIKQFFND
jgi:dTDP-4-amino-4,6-dideoxygalactose transaminase